MLGRFSSKPSSESKDGKPKSGEKPAHPSNVGRIVLPPESAITPGNKNKNLHLSLDVGAVYVAMFEMVNVKHYHWALVVATNPRSGMLYHNTNTGGSYSFQAYYHSHLLNSASLLALIRISSLSPLNRRIHQRFAERMQSVPVADRTCRPWLWDAIHVVAEEGFLGFDINRPRLFDDLEDECIAALAFREEPNETVMISSRIDDTTRLE
ncbi:hypothetical protein GX51_05007 [Blastomyces parvus]|uniref:Uncharacterized protein n=1 Tax=Blastomyces parvus TaxID=2060905 RepID=A0A2B7WZ26_9EURO|nr:hypothetical protein GX51_05007 [Blastomyces parvus]